MSTILGLRLLEKAIIVLPTIEAVMNFRSKRAALSRINLAASKRLAQ